MWDTPRLFTKEEDDFIVSHYSKMSSVDIAKHLGRQVQSVRKRACKLGVQRQLKRWTPEEDQLLVQAWKEHGRLDELAKNFGRGLSETSNRAKKLGCHPWRHKPTRVSGRLVAEFVNGTPVFAHRRVMEEELGRPLASEEIVHHIDGDKDNNARDNLCLLKNRAEHRKAHHSYEKLLPELIHRGYIRFNRDKGIYEVCEMYK